MKNLFIFLSLLLCLKSFSQEQRFYKYFAFNIMNSEYEIIENAQVVVDGKNVPFDSIRKMYFLEDSLSVHFNVIVYCEGYDTLKYSRNNLQGDYTSFFRSTIWLIRPTEKYYYAGEDGLKIPYVPHPDKLLVILDSRKYPRDDSLNIRFENEIKKYGLKVNHTFSEPPTEPFEKWKYDSYVGLQYRVVIQKEDGSNFDSDYCVELGYLRQMDMVYSAGPLFRIGGSKYNIVTYDNVIKIYRPERDYDSSEINRIVKEIDDRFYYDEKTNRIILPIEINEIVPKIMEKLKNSGFKGRMSMNIRYIVSKG